MQIEYSPQFSRLFKKLPEDVKVQARKKIELFKVNPYDERLHTHKLSGALYGYWAFWIDYRYRIIFTPWSKNVVRFYTVGDHSIYK